MLMKVLIIEDEQRAANQLINLLNACRFEHQLLGTIDSIEDAVDWLRNNESADLIFMDIQLADGLSFEIFQHIEVTVPIIFTTAFDEYAIQAFKVNSVDYLLKPIQEEDLKTALEKFQKSKASAALSPELLKQLLASAQAPSYRNGILVKVGNAFVQIKVEDLQYSYSEEGVTFGVVGGKRYIVDETLDLLYSTLDPAQFFRINRGQVISKKSVIKVEPYLNHRVKLSITDPRDQEFVVSRQKTTDFKSWMNS